MNKQKPKNIPPEHLYRQPGAWDHNKLKTWYTMHHVLAYVLFGMLALAIAAGILNYEVSNYTPIASQPVNHEKVDPTADWKTYTNTEYGFEFKYPGYFKTNINSGLINLQIDQFSALEVRTEENKNGFSLDEWLSESKKYYSKTEMDKLNNESEVGFFFEQFQIKIDKISGYKQLISGEGGASYYVFVPKDNKVFVIKLGSDLHFNGQDQLLKDFDLILSTFKFIDPKICIQVITKAKNNITGEVKDFPTPCDVPTGWTIIKTDSTIQ
jgi:hypothetical protein